MLKQLSQIHFYKKYWERPVDGALRPEEEPTTPRRLQLLFEALNRKGIGGKKVLDAGCGVGFFSARLKEAGYEVTGMDISEQVIQQASQKYSDIRFICNPLDSAYPFADEEFDVIFSTEVIEHVIGTYEMFAEMNRVLKKGGYLILTTPYYGLIKGLLIILFRFNEHMKNNIKGGHIRFFSRGLLEDVLADCGFSVRQVDYIGRVRYIAKGMFVVAKKI